MASNTKVVHGSAVIESIAALISAAKSYFSAFRNRYSVGLEQETLNRYSSASRFRSLLIDLSTVYEMLQSYQF